MRQVAAWLRRCERSLDFLFLPRSELGVTEALAGPAMEKVSYPVGGLDDPHMKKRVVSALSCIALARH
jgi:hypothetical protein